MLKQLPPSEQRRMEGSLQAATIAQVVHQAISRLESTFHQFASLMGNEEFHVDLVNGGLDRLTVELSTSSNDTTVSKGNTESQEQHSTGLSIELWRLVHLVQSLAALSDAVDIGASESAHCALLSTALDLYDVPFKAAEGAGSPPQVVAKGEQGSISLRNLGAGMVKEEEAPTMKKEAPVHRIRLVVVGLFSQVPVRRRRYTSNAVKLFSETVVQLQRYAQSMVLLRCQPDTSLPQGHQIDDEIATQEVPRGIKISLRNNAMLIFSTDNLNGNSIKTIPEYLAHLNSPCATPSGSTVLVTSTVVLRRPLGDSCPGLRLSMWLVNDEAQEPNSEGNAVPVMNLDIGLCTAAGTNCARSSVVRWLEADSLFKSGSAGCPEGKARRSDLAALKVRHCLILFESIPRLAKSDAEDDAIEERDEETGATQTCWFLTPLSTQDAGCVKTVKQQKAAGSGGGGSRIFDALLDLTPEATEDSLRQIGLIFDEWIQAQYDKEHSSSDCSSEIDLTKVDDEIIDGDDDEVIAVEKEETAVKPLQGPPPQGFPQPSRRLMASVNIPQSVLDENRPVLPSQIFTAPGFAPPPTHGAPPSGCTLVQRSTPLAGDTSPYFQMTESACQGALVARRATAPTLQEESVADVTWSLRDQDDTTGSDALPKILMVEVSAKSSGPAMGPLQASFTLPSGTEVPVAVERGKRDRE